MKERAEVNNFRITTALPPSRHQSLDLFEFRTITLDEVRRIILNSPSNKAPGADRINIQFIKDPIGVILGPGTNIINCSLLTSTYPSMWKIAEVVALHNCCMFVKNQFTEHLTNHNLLTKHQCDNWKNHPNQQLTLQ